MRIKKISSFCIAFVIMLLQITFVKASEDRIKFDKNPEISTEAGVTKLTYTLVDPPAGASVTLIAAYIDKDTGDILSVGTTNCNDVSALENGKISVSVEDKSSKGELKAYFWNSLSDSVSLANVAPGTPSELSVSESLSSAEINWESAYDDYDETSELKYNVYDDGILLNDEPISGNSFTADGLAWGSTYYYEVKTVDTEGEESAEGAQIQAEPEWKNTVFLEETVVSSPDRNLIWVEGKTSSEMSYVEPTTAGGLPCYQTVARPSGGTTRMGFRFTDEYLEEIKDVRYFTLEIEYFDEGTGTLEVTGQTAGALVGAPFPQDITKTNTNTWKTARVDIKFHGALGINSNNGNITFRFCNADNKPGLKVRRVTFIPTAEANEAEVFRGSYLKADGAVVSCTLNNNIGGKEVDDVGGRNAVLLSADNEEMLTFSSADASVNAGAGVVEICCYATAEETVVSLDGMEKTVEDKGKWKKIRFELSTMDGTHSLTSSSNLYIHSVRMIASSN